MTPDEGRERDARDVLGHAEGLYVGQLTAEELEAFNLLCRAGKARRSYEGAGGLLGLPKVRLL